MHPVARSALRVAALSYASAAGFFSIMTVLITSRPTFAPVTFTPCTHRPRRILRNLVIRRQSAASPSSSSSPPSSSSEQRERRRPQPKRHSSPAFEAYTRALAALLLAVPGVPPREVSTAHIRFACPAERAGGNGSLPSARARAPLSSTCEELSEGAYAVNVATDLHPDHVPAVLSHELAHGMARHAAEAVSAMILTAAPLSALRPRFIAGAILGNGDAANMVLDTVTRMERALMWFVVLPRLRACELEADAIGATLLARAGMDPRASMAALTAERPHLAGHGDGDDDNDDSQQCHEVWGIPLNSTRHRDRYRRGLLGWFARGVRKHPSAEVRLGELEQRMERLTRLRSMVLASEGDAQLAQMRRDVERKRAAAMREYADRERRWARRRR